MSSSRLVTGRLELRVLPPPAAAALVHDREEASRILAVPLADSWPQPDLMGVLHRQAGATEETRSFGIWVIIERACGHVVGDAGFHGPPDAAGTVEVGYCIVPERRHLGFATEAVAALVQWALAQPGVQAVVAGCDPDNAASVATLERVGFLRSGEANGELRWRYGGARVGT